MLVCGFLVYFIVFMWYYIKDGVIDLFMSDKIVAKMHVNIVLQ